MTGISYELGSRAKLMTAVKELLSNIGLPLGILAPLAWLWNQGHGSLMLLAAALLLGAHVYLLDKRLPGHQGKFTELSELNAQKSQVYASLQRRLVLASWVLPVGNPVSAQPAGFTSAASRWRVTLAWADAWFNRHLGGEIWTYAVFIRLFSFAVAYPMVFILAMWVLTDVGQMGRATILPSYGLGWVGFVKRLGVCFLLALPIFPWIIARIFRPHWVKLHSGTKHHRKWLIPSVLLFLIGQVSLASLGMFPFTFTLILVLGFLLRAAANDRTSGPILFAFIFSVAVMGAFPTGVGDEVSVWAFVIVVSTVSAAASLMDTFLEKRDALGLARHQFFAVGGITVCLALVLFAAVFLGPQFAANSNWFGATEIAFTMVLFLGILPLCNALFDWLSVSVTRMCLRQIAAKLHWAVGLILLDIALGLALTVGLFALVLKILQWMQAAGWGIDAQAMVAAFRADPLDPQVSWIAMLALTNMLPTLIHLVISFWGLVSAQMRMPREHVGAQVHSLVALLDANGRFVGPAVAPPQTSLILGSNGRAIAAKPAPTPAHQPISTADLNALFNYLYVDHWLVLLTVLGVVVALWSQYLTVLAWFLGLLV
jgi:hypothetical protein